MKKPEIVKEKEDYSEKVKEKLGSLSKKEVTELNEEIINNTKKEHEEFEKNLKKGRCYICGFCLNNFNEKNPCLHWLLRPKGFKKRHFKLIYKKFNYSQIDCYLRWIANYENPAGNINDLSEEKSKNKIIETTIKYKNLEWSFSCGANDLIGHHNQKMGDFPHYHFQMKINNFPFIGYSDFHIPFTSYDLFLLDVKKNKVKKINYFRSFDAGMEEISRINPKTLLKGIRNTNEDSKKTFHLQTMVTAEPGKKISGDKIADLIEESQKTGIPLARLLQKLKEGKIKTIISPGEGVPAINKRRARKKRKRRLDL